MADKWCFSRDEEDWFGADDRDAAIAEGEAEAREYELDCYYVAPANAPDLDKLVAIDGDSILERIDEAAFESSMPEGWEWLSQCKPEHVRELEADLKSAVITWLKRHGYEPGWFVVGTPERIVLTTQTPTGAAP